jgi:hypothetical protein
VFGAERPQTHTMKAVVGLFCVHYCEIYEMHWRVNFWDDSRDHCGRCFKELKPKTIKDRSNTVPTDFFE